MTDGRFPPMPHRERIDRIGGVLFVTLAIATAILFMAAVGLLFSLLACPVNAQDPGEYYHGLSRADGMNCCGGHDCRALLPSELRGGTGDAEYDVLYNGKWLLVPVGAILDTPSWDGRNHACIGDYSSSGGSVSVRCLILDIRS